MLITMLKKVKHKCVTYALGTQHDLSEVLANDWINSGYAEAVREGEEIPEAVKAPRNRRPTKGGEG